MSSPSVPQTGPHPAPCDTSARRALRRARFTIVLGSYNGEKWLADQLASYKAQTDTAWDLWVSDDGSTDATRDIVRAFASEVAPTHAVRLIDGPGRGFATNFLSALCHPDFPAGPVALSDQDDVWHPGKLAHARAGLGTGGPVTIYGALLRMTDAGLQPIGRSSPPKRPPGFGNALAQNVVSGNSLVLSPGALDLVRRVGVPAGVPYHDWWLYQMVSGAGGSVVIDPRIVVDYRQHGQNTMGAHRGFVATLERTRQVLGRDYGDWIAANIAALKAAEAELTRRNRARLRALTAVPVRPGLARMRAFARAGVYRQTRLTTLALYLAAVLGRV